MQIAEQQNQISFGVDTAIGTIILVSSLIDAKFPDYKAIIPKQSTAAATFKRADMLSAVRVAGLFARDNSNIIRLSVKGDDSNNAKTSITVAATSSESGDGSSIIDATTEGGRNVEIAFNAAYISAALSSLNADMIRVELTEPNRPGKFTIAGVAESQYMHICMPMHKA